MAAHVASNDLDLGPDPLITREPVRLPMWVASLLSILITVAINLISGMDWRTVTIGALTIFSTTFLGAEVARQRSWSESSVWLATTQARQDATAKTATPTITVQSIGHVPLDDGPQEPAFGP